MACPISASRDGTHRSFYYPKYRVIPSVKALARLGVQYNFPFKRGFEIQLTRRSRKIAAKSAIYLFIGARDSARVRVSRQLYRTFAISFPRRKVQVLRSTTPRTRIGGRVLSHLVVGLGRDSPTKRKSISRNNVEMQIRTYVRFVRFVSRAFFLPLDVSSVENLCAAVAVSGCSSFKMQMVALIFAPKCRVSVSMAGALSLSLSLHVHGP